MRCSKVLLENDTVRVLEYALRITTEDGSSFEVTETTGVATWMSELGRHFAENVGPTTVRILLVEVKAAARDERDSR